MPIKALSSGKQRRLEQEANIWLASVRPEGRPHLMPVWFVWHGQKFYACIQTGSVKSRNIEQKWSLMSNR